MSRLYMNRIVSGFGVLVASGHVITMHASIRMRFESIHLLLSAHTTADIC